MAPLNDDEKHLLAEMVVAAESTPVGQDPSFWLIDANYDDPLPRLSHRHLPDGGKPVTEGDIAALEDARFLRLVKPGSKGCRWFVITETARQYYRRMQSGEPEEEEAGLQLTPQIHYYAGANMSTTISGGVTGSNLTINSTLTNVVQSIGAMPNADESAKAELTKLIGELQQQLNNAPPALGNDANRVSKRVQDLVDEAVVTEPDKSEVESSAGRLISAAAKFAGAVPVIISTVEKITDLIHKIVQSAGGS